MPGMQASREGVQPLQAVGQAVPDQEFQRAIGHGRLVPEPGTGQPLQDVIGAHRAVRFQQDLQRAPPDRSQPPAPGGDTRLGPVQRAGGAGLVVMWHKGGRRNVIAHVILSQIYLTCYLVTLHEEGPQLVRRCHLCAFQFSLRS